MSKSKLLLLLVVSTLLSKGYNLIENGGFESSISWDLWNGEIVDSDVHSGWSTYFVEGVKDDWQGGEQTVAVPDGTAKIVLSAFVKTENVVPGKKEWNKASVGVEWQDINREKLGDYPPALVELVGTNDWKEYRRTYPIIKGAKYFLVSAQIDNATGKAWFDDFVVIAIDSAGDTLRQVQSVGPTDSGRYYPLNKQDFGKTFVDWSLLLDAPAGKHGFLQTKGEKFIFEDGTEMRVNGVVLADSKIFASKDSIDFLVERIAKLGFNMLRLHHFDAPWAEPNIFANKASTRKLDPEMLKRMDYLIYKCKLKGIYLFVDLVDHRDYTQADGVEVSPPELGAKQVGFFSKKIIELQKEYAKNLFNHVNSYTGLRWADDPAIAMTEIINETSIYTHFGGDITMGTPYRDELDSLWKASGHKGILASFTTKWNGSRPILENQLEGADVIGSIKFLEGLEEKYFNEMKSLLKDTIGLKIPIVGSNYPSPILAMVKSGTALDFTATSAYWDHPELWIVNDDWDRIKEAPIENRSQLRSRNNLIELSSYFRIKNMPFVIWGNHSYPSEYQYEDLPLRAVYSLLNGWGGVMQHEFGFAPLGTEPMEAFMVNQQPEDIALSVVTAPIFIKGYIEEAKDNLTEYVSADEIYTDSSFSPITDSLWWASFVTKFQKSFNKGEGNLEKASTFYRKYVIGDSIVNSETKELSWNVNRGLLKIDAPKVNGFVGFINGKSDSLSFMSIDIDNSNSSIILISADDKLLQESNKLYLVTVGPAKMKGQKFNMGRTTLTNIGDLPIMIPYTVGTVTVNGKYDIYPLSVNGDRKDKLTSKFTNGKTTVDLSNSANMVYELIRK